jgi:FAD/FMN-containing dehydrogenase
MAGLTLGGGYGPLRSRYGMACDSLLGAEVVLADGRVAQAGPGHDEDLLWALRGGGGSFGVVTSLRLRLHPAASVLSGAIAFPWEQAEGVLNGYREAMADAPDALTVVAGAFPGPDGPPTRVPVDATAFALRRPHVMVQSAATWSPHDPAGAQPHRAWARELDEALTSHSLPGGYANLLNPTDGVRVAQAFGHNIGRLRELKRRYDPDNVFSAAFALGA